MWIMLFLGVRNSKHVTRNYPIITQIHAETTKLVVVNMERISRKNNLLFYFPPVNYILHIGVTIRE